MSHLFLLGGHDLEMLEIARLVTDTLGADAVRDEALPWHGAKASAYAGAIDSALARGVRPVLVELELDLPAATLERCHVVDHHGDRAGADRPTSLEQVFALLGLPASAWTRRHALVAANDRGWIPELRAMGASAGEISAIRAEDRRAQGVSAEEEAAVEAALARSERRLGGTLVVVRLPHARTAPVFDRLAVAAGNAPPPDTLVVSPRELNFSGTGARVRALAAAWPQGWSGGALPERGFWGIAAPLPALDEVLAALGPAEIPMDQEPSR